MISQSLKEEKKLWRKGYKLVAGLDEAGRGALAGPVVAAAVICRLPLSAKLAERGRLLVFSALKDSKQLSAKKREEFYKIITKNSAIEWGIGKVSEKVIDKINILEATKLAMKRAIKNLEKKCFGPKISGRRFLGKVDFLILDGKIKLALPVSQKSIIKADEKIFSCQAASIIAKVRRDKIMMKYHKKYPQYGFEKHKGYPTQFHRQMLKKYQPSAIHRRTFSLVKTKR